MKLRVAVSDQSQGLAERAGKGRRGTGQREAKKGKEGPNWAGEGFRRPNVDKGSSKIVSPECGHSQAGRRWHIGPGPRCLSTSFSLIPARGSWTVAAEHVASTQQGHAGGTALPPPETSHVPQPAGDWGSRWILGTPVFSTTDTDHRTQDNPRCHAR